MIFKTKSIYFSQIFAVPNDLHPFLRGNKQFSVGLTKFHYAAYIPSPKGLDLVQSRSLRSLALTGQASVDGRVLRRRG